jgi:signal transduction histidine kinase/CheY-like chemotaxis protein
MFGPAIFTVLLLNRQSSLRVVFLTIATMAILTALKTDVLTMVRQTFIPALTLGVFALVSYINAGSISEIIHWAVDIQQKDARRADDIFEQKEQLVDAMRQLTHAHSRLEMLNTQLAEAKKKTELASQAKSVFLSNMSHELRTPLNVIIGYTSSMLDMPEIYDDNVLSPSHRRSVQLVKDSGYYLLGLINDILDLSKIEAGKLELHWTAVDLVREFKGILATSVGLAKDKPIQIRPDFPENLPFAWADPTRVRQILLNLMSNAIKFTHTGSVTLHAHAEGETLYISVIDTGIGISEKAIAHIFDRFEQAERDTDKMFGGTGLGLDISKHLARMHGTDLTVQSVLGQGSSFTFTLSIATGQQLQDVDDRPSDTHSVKMLAPAELAMSKTILIVEDDSNLRDMMRRTLENVGYNVVDIQDGAEVMDMVTGLLPDLIILDIHLPNVDGWELLTKIKQDPEIAQIPVMICTVDEDEHKAQTIGAALYSRKPFSVDEFLACVNELLPNSMEANKEDTQ